VSRLRGRVALVTGGGQGLGRAIARRLACEGARVAIAQRNPEPLERTAADIRAAGGEVIAVPTDVAVPQQVDRLAEAVQEAFGGVDILINNAGFNRRRSSFMEIDLAAWNEVLGGNLTGPFLCAKAVVPGMIERRWGRIVNVGALQAWWPLSGNAAYASAKGGLVSLTRSMAVDLTKFGIIVNCIVVGPVDKKAEDIPLDTRDWPTLLGRRGLPSEVASLAAYLASDECSFVIGQTIVCDGGRSLSREPEVEQA
jgi:NAD(P)-dependent dehydrogenase (short-subunit alcohol dehydrogenase family)